MSERLKAYIGFMLVIPFLATFFIGRLDFIEGEWVVLIYFLSLISTHLIVSKIQEMIH
ncbi:hypothetical protein [Ornithinibacillus californiensis]|uniref:hypothetical protein n=1 Tax=Ornithinibacillus californiensis TaxID=161536 RepID=UPI0012ED7D4D|nr:hypothetical protein [Ornithinibacillus californiensis]